jgi:hypothetical protein
MFYQYWNEEWKKELNKQRVRWVVNESKPFMRQMFSVRIKSVISAILGMEILIEINGKEMKVRKTYDRWELISKPKKIDVHLEEKLSETIEKSSLDKMIEQVKWDKIEETVRLKEALNCDISLIEPTFYDHIMMVDGKEYVFINETQQLNMIKNYVYFHGLSAFLFRQKISLSALEKECSTVADELIKQIVRSVLEKKPCIYETDSTDYQQLYSYVEQQVMLFEQKKYKIVQYDGWNVYKKNTIEYLL